MKVSFLGIGAPKSGTSWLAEVLASHPEVCFPYQKELNYFSSLYKKETISWYESFFELDKNHKVAGEISVSYCQADKGIPERIHSYNPDIKIIFFARNPVERSISHYRWLRQIGRQLPDSIIEAIDVEPSILSYSLYDKLLAQYYNIFPAENILVLPYEQIKTNPDKIQDRLYSFLDIDNSYRSKMASAVIGKTINPRSRTLEKVRVRTFVWLKKHRLTKVIFYFKKTGLSGLYRKINSRNDFSPITTEEYQQINNMIIGNLQYFSDKFPDIIDSWGIKLK